MSFLIVTCLVCALPSLLPIIRIVNKKELNMFDFIILFSTLHFCISPIKEGSRTSFTDDGVFNISSNPQPIGFRGNLLVKRQKFFYCT